MSVNKVTLSKTHEDCHKHSGEPYYRVKLTIVVTVEQRDMEFCNYGGSIICESWGFDSEPYEQIHLRGDNLSVCGMEHFAEYATSVYGNNISAMLAELFEEAKNFV